MYKQNKLQRTTITRNTSYQGETIEQKVNRILNNKEPIKDGAPKIYTERKDGVKPEHDIRTDRFEIAVEATDLMSRSKKAKREERMKTQDEEQIKMAEKKIKDGGAEPTQATDIN